MPRDPNWTWDETVLALDFYARHHPQPPSSGHPDFLALSELLNEMGIQLGVERTERYRNPDGIYMKLMNFRRFDPDFIGTGRTGLSRGASLEEDVFKLYWGHNQQLAIAATAIQQLVEAGQQPRQPEPLVEDDGEDEGGVVLVTHKRRERAPGLAERKRQAVFNERRRLACECCDFDFSAVYGDRGAGFAEVHHNNPLALAMVRRTRLTDLAIVCANCHRMLHRQGLITVEQLREIIRRHG